MKQTAAQRSAKYAEQQKAKGLVRRAYWVPADKEEEAKKLIDQLTNEANK